MIIREMRIELSTSAARSGYDEMNDMVEEVGLYTAYKFNDTEKRDKMNH